MNVVIVVGLGLIAIFLSGIVSIILVVRANDQDL